MILCLLLWSCEKEKSEIVDTPLNSPFASSLQLHTAFVNLDTSSVSVVRRNLDGSYTVSDTVVARISDQPGMANSEQVIYHVYQPGDPDYFATGSLQLSSSDESSATYKAAFAFNLHRPDIGQYRIEVQAQNLTNLASNSLFASVTVTRNNKRPQIYNLSAPDTLVRPNSGRRPVFFAVSAGDSDGAGDIASVFFRSVNSTNPNFEFRLYDDGNLAVTGDSVAGDGRYSLVIPIDSTATLGSKEFRFWARDKSSALSDSLVHIITIIPSPE